MKPTRWLWGFLVAGATAGILLAGADIPADFWIRWESERLKSEID
jgi:hypothetical protein